jgi:hypothetical protein
MTIAARAARRVAANPRSCSRSHFSMPRG